MLVTWEAKDIKAGRRVKKPGTREAWMIGYHATGCNGAGKYTLVSLNDGMVCPPQTAEQLAETLNLGGELPEELLPADTMAVVADRRKRYAPWTMYGAPNG